MVIRYRDENKEKRAVIGTNWEKAVQAHHGKPCCKGGMDSPAQKGEMMRERFNKISSIRTFENSPARYFMLDGQKVRRSALTAQSYDTLKKQIKAGKILAVQRIK